MSPAMGRGLLRDDVCVFPSHGTWSAVGWWQCVPSHRMGSTVGWWQCVTSHGTGSAVGWCPWVSIHGMGSLIGWCLWVPSHGMDCAHPRLDASSQQLVASRALWSRQTHAVAPLGSLALLPSLAWSHPLLLAPVLHSSPSSFGTLPGRLSQLWLLCARPGFVTSGSATHPHCPQPWQGAGTHPGTPGTPAP